MPEYRPVSGFLGYRVGSDGTVWSCWRRGGLPVLTDVWRQRKLKTSKSGYVMAGLKRKDGYHWLLVHRLVLEAFVGPCPEGQECRHFPDSTRSNNNLSNLSWGTRKQNHDDKRLHGSTACGERVGTSKLTAEQVFEIRSLHASGEFTQTAMAIQYGISQAAVSQVVLQRTWRHLKGGEING